MNRRILWIDFSKGLAMLMVIAGHSLGAGGLSGLLHGAIFSFHMPLFFLLSGLLCLDSPSSERRVKVVGLARKLLTPCIIIISIRWTWGWFCNGINPNGPLSEIVDKSLSVLMASGVPVRFFDKAIDPIGSCWFLVVLFGAHILYGFIPGTRIIRGVVCICLSLLGYLISQQTAVLFDADLIMIAVLFLYIGQTLKWVANRFDGRINSLKLLMYSGALWMCLLACVFFC